MPGIDPVTPMRAAVNSMGDAAAGLSHLQRTQALADERRALESLLTARDELAQALVHSGRGAEAAQAYFRCAELVPEGEALRLRCLAADH